MKFRSRFFREELKKFGCLFVAMVLIISLTVGDYTGLLSSDSADTASAEETSTTVSYSDVTGSMNFSDLQVSNFSSSVLSGSEYTTLTTGDYETRTVIVSFSDDSLLEAADGKSISYYQSTAAGQKTEKAINETHKEFYQYLSSNAIEYSKVYSFKNIDNAVAIEIDTSYVSQLKELDGVESVVICDSYAEPETTTSGSSSATTNATSVYSTGVYDSSKYVEEYGGKGMTVAILDTGLDYTHDAFLLTDDPDDYYYEYSQTFRQNMRWSESDVDAFFSDPDIELNASGNVYVSDKVPFAFDYSDNDADVYPSYSNHGTHVAGIIAGRASYYSDSDGNIVYKDGYSADNVYYKSGYDYMFTDDTYEELATEEFIGVAPYAQLVICKVFTDDLDDENVGGATTEDILAALEDCISLEVDVINMSLGSTNGFSSTNDGDDEGEYMNNIYTKIGETGISLVVAASNDYSSGYGSTFGTNLASNPDSGTVGSPSTYAAAISVASISGKKSSYLIANEGTDSETSVFFRESADENSVDYDFVAQMLALGTAKDTSGNYIYTGYNEETQELKIMYVVIPGVGQLTDYTTTIKRAIANGQSEGYLVVALVKRGTNTFQDKVENAMSIGVDGVVVYNNVAGEIKMTIGDIEDPIPAISITQVAGQALVDAATSYVGYLTICEDYEAGPFMSDFSSWGVTSDLKLKPEITAHGGEITSSVPGGYSEMSGTSMATPNVSGLMANILSYIKQNYDTTFYSVFYDKESDSAVYSSKTATQLAYQLLMSTATTVYDEDGLPYSPRKQGAGLGSLDNVVSTQAYLYTIEGQEIESKHGTYYGADTGRPKIELGEDESKVGEYTLVFYYNNLSSGTQTFELQALFFTESLSLDGLAVAEQAYYLEGQDSAVWTIDGKTYSNGDKVTLGTGSTTITVTLTLTENDKAYLDESFVNGMFIEGFLQLVSLTDGQCDLSIPFMGFYGDWESAPMLDYSAYEIAEIEADTSIKDEEKASETVWATQAYTEYWNGNYVLPMGSYLYSQDEDADQIYASEEYAAVSCYNDETATSSNNSSYMTSYAIKGLYAGLLRNAKYVTATLTDATTGEVIYTKVVYRVGKAIAGGGSASPAYVKLDLSPEALGLVENGTYTLEFNFFFKSMDEEITDDNTFKFSFTIDYTAPVLDDLRIRYVDYKDSNGNAQQRVYLDLDIYDNHYAMSVLLCYESTDSEGETEFVLATDYVTPVYNAVRNGTTTVTIEITDLMELVDNGLALYVEIDDYALNHSIYAVSINTATSSVLPDTFTVNEDKDDNGNYAITVGKLSTYTISLDWDTETYSSANLSNFTWTVISGSSYVAVKNGEVVGLQAGTARIMVSGNGVSYTIYVTVTDSNKKITSYPSLSFGTIYNASDVPVAASGTVEVNIEQQIQLEVQYDPWYYEYVADEDKVAVNIVWSSLNTSVAEVTDDGLVTFKKKGSTTITATIDGTAYSATVRFSVQEAFTVSSYSLTDYTGAGGVVYIPTDMNIMTIGEEAFKDNTSITAVVIPKTVTTIGKKAFSGCTNLKYVFFVDVTTQEVADAELTLINPEAFENCTSLEYVDFSNCKTFTVAKYAFNGCTSLKVIKGLENMGTAYDGAFYGCTSLVGSLSSDSDVSLVNSVTYYDGTTLYDDLDGLYNLVKNTSATDIRNVSLTMSETETSSTTSSACVINIKSVDEVVSQVTTLDITGLHVSGSYVFSGCNSLFDITTGQFTSIGTGMFYDCDGKKFNSVTIKTSSVGAYAFYDCAYLKNVTFSGITNGTIGAYAFASEDLGNLSSVTFEEGVTISSIGSYAFARNNLTTFTLPSGLTSLGDDLFYGGELNTLVITTDISNVEFTGSTFDSIASISVEEAAEAVIVNNIIYNKDKTKIILALGDKESYEIEGTVTEIGSYAFASNSNLTSITLPESLTTIGDYAFYKCTALTAVTIPANVTSLGEGAFYRCSALKTITFADGSALKTVGGGAFENTAITAMSLPSGVTYVGSYAFAGTPITSLEYAPAENAEFGSYVFANCTSLETITLADNITVMGDGTFYNCTSLTSVTLPSVEELGWYTFFGATNLQSVAFGKNAKTTGDYTFYSYDSSYSIEAYDSLTSVTLGDNTTEIGSYAFINCTALTSVDLSNIKTVNEYAFWNNTALTSVTGLGGVKVIGAYAFYNCPLTTVDISSATKIGDFAFYGNAATSIEIPETLESTTTETVSELSSSAVFNVNLYYDYNYTYSSLGSGVFANASNLTSFTVAEGNEDYFADDGVLYRILSDGSYELLSYPSAKTSTSYTVIDDTVRIDAYAFAYLTAGKLTSVTMPYELATIGIGAFYSSGVTTYNFTSVTAPTLEAELNYETTTSSDATYYSYYMTYFGEVGGLYRGLYNTNFGDELINHTENIVFVYNYSSGMGNVYASASTLSVTYPSNGTGYDNYVYSHYFGTVSTTAEVLSEDSYAVLKALTSDSWYSVDEINSWATADVATYLDIVTEFSELVKDTHRSYNNMKNTSTQVELLTARLAENNVSIDLLSETEEALSPIKAIYGITVTFSSAKVDTSSYKSTYVVGEKFDMTGLTVVVTYDDYSEITYTYEDGELELASNYDRELTIYDQSVKVVITELNKNVYPTITVTEETEDPDEPVTPDDSSSSDSSADTSSSSGEDSSAADSSESEESGSGCSGTGCGSIITGGGMGGGLGLGTALLIVAIYAIVRKKGRNSGEINE